MIVATGQESLPESMRSQQGQDAKCNRADGINCEESIQLEACVVYDSHCVRLQHGKCFMYPRSPSILSLIHCQLLSLVAAAKKGKKCHFAKAPITLETARKSLCRFIQKIKSNPDQDTSVIPPHQDPYSNNQNSAGFGPRHHRVQVSMA
jgi:hypothetical protein